MTCSGRASKHESESLRSRLSSLDLFGGQSGDHVQVQGVIQSELRFSAREAHAPGLGLIANIPLPSRVLRTIRLESSGSVISLLYSFFDHYTRFKVKKVFAVVDIRAELDSKVVGSGVWLYLGSVVRGYTSLDLDT